MNQPFRNKPYGGLWATPTDTDFGWLEWCDREDYESYEPNNSFMFHLSDDAKVWLIDNSDSARDLKERYGSLPDGMPEEAASALISIDFEQMMADGYDAIEFRITHDWSLYSEMYGWDCDSLLVLNPDIIITT